MSDTPEPMLTSRHGNCGVGLLSKETPYFGGSGLGRSRIWGTDAAGWGVLRKNDDASPSAGRGCTESVVVCSVGDVVGTIAAEEAVEG